MQLVQVSHIPHTKCIYIVQVSHISHSKCNSTLIIYIVQVNQLQRSRERERSLAEAKKKVQDKKDLFRSDLYDNYNDDKVFNDDNNGDDDDDDNHCQ